MDTSNVKFGINMDGQPLVGFYNNYQLNNQLRNLVAYARDKDNV